MLDVLWLEQDWDDGYNVTCSRTDGFFFLVGVNTFVGCLGLLRYENWVR
jgi:hypothetical protein